jgi:NAD(P)-dependent dehydrogenase (short-subunit alcohol dehydrogenase family)
MKADNLYTGTNFDLNGKVAIVTGGCGLLGKEFSKALISAGANVIIGDIDQNQLTKTKDLIYKQFNHSNISSMLLDITNEESIENFVSDIEKEYGKIDILVNSAAIDPKFEKGSKLSEFTRFENFPLTAWNESININLTGTFQITQAVCAIMNNAGKGSIINIGSNYGIVGPDQRIYKQKNEKNQSYKPIVYSVCKAALIGFTKYLATYYAGSEIRVNMLTPAGVLNNHDEEFIEKYSANTILGRMSEKNEYWGSIIYLASDASSYMTGSNLIVDGGWTSL